MPLSFFSPRVNSQNLILFWIFIPSLSFATVANEVQTAEQIGDEFETVMFAFAKPGQPVQRPVFAKDHGCVRADFIVNPGLPEEWRVGVFANPRYPAWIRFSNDGPAQEDTVPSARGMAIKLVGVDGKKLLEKEINAKTQDFILQNHPVFFVNDAKEFLEFTKAVLSRNPEDKKTYDEKYPHTEEILSKINAEILANPLEGQYWTPTPYRLGKHAIKYKVKSCVEPVSLANVNMVKPNFLRENLKSHLKKSPACMKFYIQFENKKDPEETPIDRATVLWSDEKTKSPFFEFAEIQIPEGQDIDRKNRKTLCENLSFNTWHSLPEHEPLGSINRVRKIIYQRMAERRRDVNKVIQGEPTQILSDE